MCYLTELTFFKGNTAMHYAVSHEHFDVVSILLDSKMCDIDKRNAAGYTCSMLVSLAEVKSITHRQVVRKLFQLANVNCRAKQVIKQLIQIMFVRPKCLIIHLFLLVI